MIGEVATTKTVDSFTNGDYVEVVCVVAFFADYSLIAWSLPQNEYLCRRSLVSS